MWNLEKEKKVGFILLPSTEYSPNFDHHKLCACMETAICSPSFRVRTFSCGPWQTFKRAALLQLPILYGSRWFQASWKYSRLKIRNLLFQLAFHIQKRIFGDPPGPTLGPLGWTSCRAFQPRATAWSLNDVSSTCCVCWVFLLCFLNFESFIFVYFCCWVFFYFPCFL